MVYILRANGEVVESEEFDREMLDAIGDRTRQQILGILAEEPLYPSKLAEELNISKQKVYYHFDKLEEAGLIQEKTRKEKSGGTARYFAPSSAAFHFDLGIEGKKTGFRREPEVEKFLSPLVDQGELKGSIVVGSPDDHGPDQVRARDGHLAGDICMKLGGLVRSGSLEVKLDTEIINGDKFGQNMLILGGILTNTVARRFNSDFPVRFEGDEFPYRRIETDENSYTSPEVGFITKTENPEDPEKSIFIAAGVRNRGTRTAVLAFKNLDEIISEGTKYVVVKGLDMDGDGVVDDFDVLEEG